MAERDSIDLGTAKISKLFKSIFIPTLWGMLSYSFVTVIDGMFVGRGVGSDAIAAINICFPIFLIITGFALMIGMGASVVASVHLSQNNFKAARINVTQALLFLSIMALFVTIAVELFATEISNLLGSSESLLPMVRDYMVWLVPAAVTQVWSVIGLFIIRLDGAPKYAMWCSVIPAVLNIPLDWLFIYPLDMGVKGAAIASMICTLIGGFMAMGYILFATRTLSLYPLKMTMKSLKLSFRNIGYQCKIGVSALIGECTMAMLMFVGNLVFMRYMGDAGVGAYGIACYYLPFVFNVGNSIAQSAQPIISYNYGCGNNRRVRMALPIVLRTAVYGSLLSIAAFIFFPEILVGLFVDLNDEAAQIAVSGFPYFAVGFLFFILNLVAIGFFQSVERVAPATFFALSRGLLFLVPAFYIAPILWGSVGIWLSMPLSELVTFLLIVIYCLVRRRTVFPD